MSNKLIKLSLIGFYALLIVCVGFIVYQHNLSQYEFDVQEKDITMILGDDYTLNLYASGDYSDASNYIVKDSNNILNFDNLTIHAKKVGETTVVIKSKKNRKKREIKVKVILMLV